MNTRTLSLVASLLAVGAHAQQAWDLTASDFQFTPDLLTITAGDTVHLHLDAGHSFTEIPRSAWELNVTSPVLEYDFGPYDQLNNDHYLVLTDAPDTLYYICVPHADMGMKGRIIVQPFEGIHEQQLQAVDLFPVPATDIVQVRPVPKGAVQARIIDGSGRTVAEMPVRDGRLDVGGVPNGSYQVLVCDAKGRVQAKQALVVQH